MIPVCPLPTPNVFLTSCPTLNSLPGGRGGGRGGRGSGKGGNGDGGGGGGGGRGLARSLT